MPPAETFFADLHIHSKYSRACSRDCDLEHLTWWAKRKGITLVGTGDLTHPAWNAHLHETLVPAEPGLYRLRDDLAAAVDATQPPALASREVRFLLSVEISTIYSRDGRTRKVHHLVYLPDLDAAGRFNKALGRIGNLGSDGRPILGLDSRDLLEITLDASPDAYVVPAHIWTPWFAALGSKSGFDAVADCYADLAEHVFAVETGLSSDPPMNWRVSALDRYTLVSNSDAHSPPALGREAHGYTCALDYFAVRDALRTGEGYAGSLEFFPEEGKYHADGHRACDVRLEPAETAAAGGRCPGCGKPVTVGVLSRVEALADRPPGARPPGRAAPFTNFVQLPQVVGEIAGVGPRSKSVTREVDGLVAALGPELAILRTVPVEDVAAAGGTLLGEAVARLRRGEVIRESGYDGEYGVIRLFEPAELRRQVATAPLFDLPEPEPAPRAPQDRHVFGGPAAADHPENAAVNEDVLPLELPTRGLLEGLDPEQRAAAGADPGPLLIVAGPGTGKTRTLTSRIAHLVGERGVDPASCLAITFTRRAAGELADRLAALVPGRAARVTVATFHALALRIVREQHARLGLDPALRVADQADQETVLTELTGNARAPWTPDLRERYAKTLHARGLVGLDELVPLAVEALADTVAAYRDRWRHVLVDEYQDVDEAQYQLLRLLAPPDGDLCAIGDPDQAIYSFRGADVGFFLRFAEDYPAARTVALTRNYRSAPPIVAGAVQAVRPTTLVPDRVLTAERRDLGAARIGLHRAAGEADEAAQVARTIDALVGGASFHSLDSGRVDGRDVEEAPVSFADVAVLYRTDGQARAVMEALGRAGIPYQKRGHDRLADRPGVRAVVRELRHHGTGPLAERVRHAAGAVADRAMTPDLFTGDVHWAGDAAGAAATATTATAGAAGADTPGGGDRRGADAWSAADLLAPLAERCDEDAEAFLTAVATGAEVDALDPRADAVSLLTLHAAKGLEFEVVFLVGCVDGLLPLRWPGEDPAGRAEREAEERRLFFVGMTRARRRLHLSAPREVARRGMPAEAPPSPFLAVLDSGLLDRTGDASPRARQPRQLRLI